MMLYLTQMFTHLEQTLTPEFAKDFTTQVKDLVLMRLT